MSDRSDAIDVRDLRPGMRIEIVQRSWTGTVVSIKGPGGLFTALRDGDAHSTGEETAWSPSVIDRIRLLAADLPLPTEPGARFWASLPGCDPMWWFATRGQADDESEPVTVWIGQDGTDVHEDDPEDVGLVRLPDPADAHVTDSAAAPGRDLCSDCGCQVTHHEGSDRSPDVWCRHGAWPGFIPDAYIVEHESIPDPLPTARHARVVARVYRHPYEGWRVLTRYTEDDHHGIGFDGYTRGAPWRSDVPVDGEWWHQAEHIQEWKPLATGPDSLGEVFGGAS